MAPEAARDFRFPLLRQIHGEYTSPLTSRLLVEAVGMHLYERWGFMHMQSSTGSDPEFEDIAPQMISVTEQSNGLVYRAPTANNNNTRVPNFTYRAALAYVTGSHSFKTGFNRTHGYQETTNYNLNPLAFQFNGGVPNQLTMRANPVTFRNHLDNDLGIFAQDKWTLKRTTVNLALRYDHFASSFPEQVVGPAELAPTRNFVFPAEDNLNWDDITYRTGLIYDLRGNGKTAVKVTFNKYLRGQTLNLLGTDPNPVNTMVTTANRTWNDATVISFPTATCSTWRRMASAWASTIRCSDRRRGARHSTTSSGAATATARRTGSSRPACSTKSCRACPSTWAISAESGRTSA